jgi:hypothetical protein
VAAARGKERPRSGRDPRGGDAARVGGSCSGSVRRRRWSPSTAASAAPRAGKRKHRRRLLTQTSTTLAASNGARARAPRRRLDVAGATGGAELEPRGWLAADLKGGKRHGPACLSDHRRLLRHQGPAAGAEVNAAQRPPAPGAEWGKVQRRHPGREWPLKPLMVDGRRDDGEDHVTRVASAATTIRRQARSH